MLQLILMSLGAYVFQAAASPAFPFPPVLPPVSNVGNPPTLPTSLATDSLPTGGVIPTPILLTSVPGASVPSVTATAFPSLPGVSAPTLTILTARPSLSGVSVPSAGLPTPTLPGSGIPTSGLPTASFPPLPILTNSVLLSSISAVLSAVTNSTAFPTSGVPLPSTVIPTLPNPSGTVPGLPSGAPGSTGLPNPASIVTNLSSAIEILLLLIRMIQETINTGGVRVPGVAEIGLDVGTNLLGTLLKVAADYLDKAGAVGALAF